MNLGINVQVKDLNNGLKYSAGSETLAGVNADLNTNEGVGIQGISGSSSISPSSPPASITIGDNYNQTGNTVGILSTTNATLLSSNLPSLLSTSGFDIKAKVNLPQTFGTYTDTITFTLQSN